MKKKTNKLKQTVGAFMAALAMIGSPTTQSKTIEPNIAKEITNANKNAIITPKEKGQGIKINVNTGGLGFDKVIMHQPANPIYIPYYHKKQTYRTQNRAAKLRKNKKK
jgi:hypothetical protein